MAKLYPPSIGGTLPAFVGTTIIVPFSMNRAVSLSDLLVTNGEYIGAIKAKIKTVQNDMFICTLDCTSMIRVSGTSYQATFELDSTKFQVGTSYKIQLAYVSASGQVGYYSTVGIVKYTTEPVVEIEGLETLSSNNSLIKFIGRYSQYGQDTTEKEYSYQFQLYDEDKNLLEDTGTLLHNTINDVYSYESYDSYSLEYTLDPNTLYYIRYLVTTRNGLECASTMYKIIDNDTVPPDIDGVLAARNNFENGYIELTFIDNSDNAELMNGTYELYRKGTGRWELIHKFNITGQKPSGWSFKDMSVEQGVKYKYCVRQRSDKTGLYSSRLLLKKVYDEYDDEYENGESIEAQFEDSFLFDGERQLHIRFNPKITSFKTDVLESKLDTIGSKTPFFFRNGNTNYKEFPISGLLSYLSDNDELFMTYDELGISNETYRRYDYNTVDDNLPTNNLVDYNIKAERLFKLEVLKWLNNGKPKLFRSPVEGNYLVRLMNTSLTPTDTLGRMLHTFTSTAYEVGEVDYETLFEYGIYNEQSIINSGEENITEQYLFKTYVLSDVYGDNDLVAQYNTELIPASISPVSILDIDDVSPGTVIEVNGNNVWVGATGSYHLEMEDGITSLKIKDSSTEDQDLISLSSGQVTLAYKVDASNVSKLIAITGSLFDRYTKIETKAVPCRQFIGPDFDILNDQGEDNALKTIEDTTRNLVSIPYMRFYKRDVEKVYYFGNSLENSNLTDFTDYDNLYFDYNKTKCVKEKSNLSEWSLYEIYVENSENIKVNSTDEPTNLTRGKDYYIDIQDGKFYKLSGAYIDPYNDTLIANGKYSCAIYFDNSDYDVDVSDKWMVSYKNTQRSEIDRIFISNGAVGEITYYMSESYFSYSNDDDYKKYTDSIKQLDDYLNNLTTVNSTVIEKEKEYINTIRENYILYLKSTEEAFEEYKKENGVNS